ncbi:hypothetical protein [Marinobacter sp. F4216]|uniref:hypothetical protein n=1 Tax=Marinobacter sp. F4216 TaxID=2874281 RepID=UPI001CC14882|nr:hypothetical protein [Marinobacter sp. F4216]MBZ2167300.1 hypothetical protein [Marinobacter sp. F4216]
MFNRIELPLRPSILSGVVAALPWLAIAAFLIVVGYTRIPWFLGAVPAALCGAWIYFRRMGQLKGKTAVTSLLLEQGQLYAQLDSGERKPVSPSPASRLGRRLSLLKLRANDSTVRAYSAILIDGGTICHGNVPGNEYRRLRVWLRLGQHTLTTRTGATND